MHARCALVSTPLPALSNGAPFLVEDSRLILDHAHSYEIGSAAAWSHPNLDCIVELNELTAHINTFVLQLDSSQAGGFGRFLPLVQALWQDTPIPDLQYSDPILQFSKSKVLDIAESCLEQDVERIVQNANALIGLGSGLTPSGDDFLGGLFFAIKTIQTNYFKNARLAFPMEGFGPRTNPISFTLLKDLANGSAVEPLHQIGNGLLGGTDMERISPSVSRLTQVGHSTGWDLLTGLLTGLLVTRRNHCFNFFGNLLGTCFLFVKY